MIFRAVLDKGRGLAHDNEARLSLRNGCRQRHYRLHPSEIIVDDPIEPQGSSEVAKENPFVDISSVLASRTIRTCLSWSCSASHPMISLERYKAGGYRTSLPLVAEEKERLARRRHHDPSTW
jgi:hypothetical protein